MKIIKITGIALAVMILSFRLSAQQTESKQQLIVPLSEPGKPYKLDVGLVTGSIRVSVYEGKDIIIDASGEPHKNEEGQSKNGMHRISGGENLDLTAEEKNNQVNIGSDNPSKFVKLVIKVPQGATSIKLATVNDGNIIASDLGGELEITNVNGYIKLTNVSGSVVANTVNGDVTVTFKSINPKAPMAFSTLNGNVDVTFPAGIKANVKLKSDRGEIYSDFDIITEKLPAKIIKSGKGGMYRLTVDDAVYGKIDGGGPEMLMKNMNGDIYIRKAK